MKMEIKTTEQIIEDNRGIIEKIMEEESHIEIYNGEFDETYLKKWVAVDNFKKIINKSFTGWVYKLL